MKTASEFSEALQRIFTDPTSGIVGLVDEFLAICREYNLQLDWKIDRYRVRPLGGEWEEWPDAPLPKPAVRGLLARLAALCNEQAPDSVSPYGGQGQLSADGDPSVVFRITFVNTPAEQKLELTTMTMKSR